MEKNWLIRTKSNHILGPVSKEKVLELFHNGSIKPDDEVCSGNGFWFFVREADMVQRFLLGREVQNFNPISEAKDVLTTPSQVHEQVEEEDITQIGAINTSLLTQQDDKTPPPTVMSALFEKEGIPLPATKPAAQPEASSAPTPTPATPKKKADSVKPTKSKSAERAVLPKQNFLQYIAILCFLILFLLVYYRKTIIRSIFQGEVTLSSLIISSAQAQEEIPGKKKKLTERSVLLDRITFAPSIKLSGFTVSTSFDIETINCSDLSNEIIQMGIILYPPDSFHEKFLLKIRQCTSELSADHPVKVWFKWVGSPKPLSADDQKTMQFLSEILNSKFNLITDINIKNKIIDVLTSIPGETLGEELLRSYLYLMIGNVTRSDNILRTITKRPPYHNWQGHSRQTSVYHQIATTNLEQILKKMAGHPSDRKSYEIFTLYLKNFANDPILLSLLDASDPNSLEGKWSLKAVTRLSPDFHQYLSLSRMEERKRQARIKNSKFTDEFKLYWLWPFFDINEIVNDSYLPPLVTLATVDKLWFYYLLDNERLSDLYIAKKGRADITAARSNLRALLKERRLFMLSLFKLIELGDVDKALVAETLKFLINE